MARNLYYEDELIREHFNLSMLKRLIAYASAYKRKFIKVQVLLVAASICELFPIALDKVIIDRVLPHAGVVPTDFIQVAVAVLAIDLTLGIGGVVANFFCDNLSNELGNFVICDLRKDIFSHLMKLGFDYFDSRPTGKILVRITNYTDEIADFFINDMTRILYNVAQMLIALICVFVIDMRLGAAVLFASIPLVIVIWLLAGVLQRRVENDRNKYSNRTAFVAEDIMGLEVILAFNREPLNEEIHEELNRKYRSAFMRTTNIREVFFPLTHGTVRIICTIVIFAVALWVVHDRGGVMTLGSMVAVSTFMGVFASGITVVCQRLQNIANTTSNIERVFDVIDTEPAVTDRADAGQLAEVEGEVRFEQVSFSYQEGTRVLSDVSVDIAAGQTIALVGPTGAGKTTFISLLDRFYDVDSGRISIDGKDLRELTLASLRGAIGVMMQDTYLFTDTIMENIRFARPDATDEECIEAAKKVNADAFIRRQKDGYDTKISGADTELSGGERQLLSFARLILADPKIIILDEATSNIDTETERMIRESLQVVLAGRTSFLVAHRLSTIRNADRILYIDGQSILEDGSHEDLMRRRGHYYRLQQALE